MDHAEKFKKAIDENDGGKAADLLVEWKGRNDANRKYAFIIFDGMPPSNLSPEELLEWLDEADGMEAENPELREWYRQTALRVIQINRSQ